MAITGCGCKICKAGLGEMTNRGILEGISPKDILKALEKEGVKVSVTLLKKHLAAFSIPYPEEKTEAVIKQEPIKVDLNKIDFTQYNFEPNNIESIIGFLQKINLKIYLNQSKITLQAQEDVLNGRCPDVPKEIFQNLAVAFQILEKSTGMSVHINQQEAIRVVEAMGLSIQGQGSTFFLPASNAENQTESEAD